MTEVTLSFLGGAGEVGKSCYIVEADGTRFMLDCGVKLTEPPSYPKIPTKIHSLILSHAHLDHSGTVPAAYRRQRMPVYGTDLTFEIAHLLQHDSVKVGGLRGYPSLYSDTDVDNLLNGEIPLQYGRPRRISENAVLTLYAAGHIPGSAGALLEINGTTLFYTGDTNNRDTLLQAGGSYPKADILITESTYGGRKHPPRDETIDEFIAAIEDTLEGGGIALVPAFGVGRSQEVLMMLDALPYPIYFDGMPRTVTRIFLSYAEYLRDADLLQKTASSATWVRHQGDRRRIVKEPCIIITTAGMLSGGPVVEYIKRLHKNPKNSILLTGYQVEGTNGRLLLNEGYIVDELSNRRYRVRMNVRQFDFSAHADQDGLAEIASQVSPKKIFCVHGDPEGTEGISQKLAEKYDASVPKLGEKISISGED